MVQGFNEFMGSIGQIDSRVQLVQGLNLFNGSIDLIGVIFQLVQKFKSLISNGQWVHLVQGLNWLKGLIGSRFQLVKVSNCNCSIGSIDSRFQFAQGFN